MRWDRDKLRAAIGLLMVFNHQRANKESQAAAREGVDFIRTALEHMPDGDAGDSFFKIEHDAE